MVKRLATCYYPAGRRPKEAVTLHKLLEERTLEDGHRPGGATVLRNAIATVLGNVCHRRERKLSDS